MKSALFLARLGSFAATPHQVSRAGNNDRPFSRQENYGATGTPSATATQNVEDGIEHFAHIYVSRMTTWFGGWDQRFKDSPLLVG